MRSGPTRTARSGCRPTTAMSRRGNITLREAMQWSANSPYVQLGMDVGTDKVKEVAIAAGLRDDSSMADSTVPSFSIGTSQPSAIRMAGAYGTFATSGHAARSVLGRRGQVPRRGHLSAQEGQQARLRHRHRRQRHRRPEERRGEGNRHDLPSSPAATWRARPVRRTTTSPPGSWATPRSCRPPSACTGWTTTRSTRTVSSRRCTARVARRRSTVPRSRPRSGTTT